MALVTRLLEEQLAAAKVGDECTDSRYLMEVVVNACCQSSWLRSA
jgi:hypothetical protein